ncbi:MAG: hypothetical protein KGZ74_18880, partial [Chitinophagaceae bacterium]|nr:hypothetical protein [Chitinophagaceae bacterium]
MKHLLFISMLVVYSAAALSQRLVEFKGFIITETDTKPVVQASILIQKVNQSRDTQIIAFGFSKSKGEYLIRAKLPLELNEVVISVSHISYGRQNKLVSVSNSDTVSSSDFYLLPSQNQLREIIVENKEPVRIKKDTVEFTADSFRTAQTRKVEDLIKNIEGFKVEADGRITYRGKEVKALLIDGDDMTQD